MPSNTSNNGARLVLLEGAARKRAAGARLFAMPTSFVMDGWYGSLVVLGFDWLDLKGM